MKYTAQLKYERTTRESQYPTFFLENSFNMCIHTTAAAAVAVAAVFRLVDATTEMKSTWTSTIMLHRRARVMYLLLVSADEFSVPNWFECVVLMFKQHTFAFISICSIYIPSTVIHSKVSARCKNNFSLSLFFTLRKKKSTIHFSTYVCLLRACLFASSFSSWLNEKFFEIFYLFSSDIFSRLPQARNYWNVDKDKLCQTNTDILAIFINRKLRFSPSNEHQSIRKKMWTLKTDREKLIFLPSTLLNFYPQWNFSRFSEILLNFFKSKPITLMKFV